MLRYFLWIMAEIAIIGSDIQEVRCSPAVHLVTVLVTACKFLHAYKAIPLYLAFDIYNFCNLFYTFLYRNIV